MTQVKMTIKTVTLNESARDLGIFCSLRNAAFWIFKNSQIFILEQYSNSSILKEYSRSIGYIYIHAVHCPSFRTKTLRLSLCLGSM
jgi:hypothetical protein